MDASLKIILDQIQYKNPNHATKLESNLAELKQDENYKNSANAFFEKYKSYLEKNFKSLDFGVGCYLHMIEDMLEERVKFIRTGQYSNTSFEDVEKRIYGNPEIMIYHMHGLVLAQFLWLEQYERVLFFTQNLKKYIKEYNKYLEIGGGHGLYIYEALKLTPEIRQFDMVDISRSSLDLAEGIINDKRINYYLKNVFDFSDDEKYDFITVGEVLEHVEDPLSLLKKIERLLANNGVCYITTPINAPMIDHIYLFGNVNEIRDLFNMAGFEIMEEKIVFSEKIPEAKAKKFKIPVMYAAFITKK